MQYYRRRPLETYHDDPISKPDSFAKAASAPSKKDVESPDFDEATSVGPPHHEATGKDTDLRPSVSDGDSAENLVQIAGEILRDDRADDTSSATRAAGHRPRPADLAGFVQAAQEICSGVQQYLDRCNAAAFPGALKGRAARGSSVSLPVSIHNPGDGPLDLALTATKLVNDAGLPLAANVNFDSPHMRVPAMATEVVNALVSVPADAVPGLYEGTVRTNGDNPLALPLSLLVSDS